MTTPLLTRHVTPNLAYRIRLIEQSMPEHWPAVLIRRLDSDRRGEPLPRGVVAERLARRVGRGWWSWCIESDGAGLCGAVFFSGRFAVALEPATLPDTTLPLL